MQPSSDQPTRGGSRSLRRYGPIIAIVAVVAIVGGIVVLSSGGDDSGDDATQGTATANLGQDALSFSQAEEQGIEVDWPDTCDTDRGQLALPEFFSPECFAPFTGDNGGATDTGVTGDTITIAYYQSPPNPISDFILGGFGITNTNEEGFATIQGYVDMYNHFAETYGRTVEVVQVEGSGPPNDDVAARADAVRIDEEVGAFMVWGGPFLTDAFADELANRGIPCIGCVLGESNQFYEDHSPYVLGIQPTTEQTRDVLVEWLSKQVAGRPAEFAGDADLQSQERTFGSLYLSSDEDSEALEDTLASDLSDEGIDLAEEVAYQLDPARLQEQAADAIARFKSAGVTSIIFTGDPVAPATFTAEATNQDYFPEWIITGSALTDTTAAARSFDQEQWAHAFGISSLTAHLDPTVAGSYYLYEWWAGEPPPADDTSGVILPFPQIFFSALQGVGPDLTRENWVQTILGNPPTPSAISQPSVNWGDDGPWDYTDWSGVDDFTEIWWDAETVGPSEIRREAPGVYQYSDGGARYTLGEWPEEDTLAFDPDGAVVIYDEAPPGEVIPDYPSPAEGG